MDRISRRLTNLKQNKISVSKVQPSLQTLREGDEILYQPKNKSLRRYRREGNILWYTSMIRDGNLSIDKNLSVDGSINLGNKLVTKKYPAFSAYQSTSVDETALATGTWTRIPLDTENYDNGSNFDTGNFKFTAPYHGVYHFDAKILLDGNADTDAGDFDAEERLDVALFKNQGDATTTSSAKRMASSLHLVAASITDSVWEGRLSTDLELATGDFIELYAWHNSGVEQHTYSNAIDDWTRFTGHLVCAL